MQCEAKKLQRHAQSNNPANLTKFVYCLTLSRLPESRGGEAMRARIASNLKAFGKLQALEKEITPIILAAPEFKLKYWNPIPDDVQRLLLIL